MAIIELENMSFYAYHGCFNEESVIGTHFRVDLQFECNTTKAELSDSIEDTISYLDVYQLVKKEMEEPSHLLEKVARRVIDRLLSEYESIEFCCIKVTKKNPPLGGKLDGVSVSLKASRSL